MERTVIFKYKLRTQRSNLVASRRLCELRVTDTVAGRHLKPVVTLPAKGLGKGSRLPTARRTAPPLLLCLVALH